MARARSRLKSSFQQSAISFQPVFARPWTHSRGRHHPPRPVASDGKEVDGTGNEESGRKNKCSEEDDDGRKLDRTKHGHDSVSGQRTQRSVAVKNPVQNIQNPRNSQDNGYAVIVHSDEQCKADQRYQRHDCSRQLPTPSHEHSDARSGQQGDASPFNEYW